jgi:hypothetical protein
MSAVRGYEVTKGQYVRVEDAELKRWKPRQQQHRHEGIHPDRESRPDLFREQLLAIWRPIKGRINPTGCSPRPWQRPAGLRWRKQFSTTRRVWF